MRVDGQVALLRLPCGYDRYFHAHCLLVFCAICKRGFCVDWDNYPVVGFAWLLSGLVRMASDQSGMLLLSDLDPSKKCVAVCVRVSRMWDYNKDGKLAHVDLVLIDEAGTKMYAEIGAKHALQFKKLIKEGDVYVLRDFFVQLSKNMFRPVEGKFMMKITPWTKIDLKTNVPPDFPCYAYSLTDFALLPALVGKKYSFIDVIGIVTAVSDLLHVRLPGQSSDSFKRNLQLTDIEGNNMDVALWGDNANNFNAGDLYKTGQSQVVIVLLVGALMKNYRGRDTISCGEAGKCYVNPPIQEKEAYCDRLGKQLPALQWMTAEDDQYYRSYEQSEPQVVDIGYLLSTDPNEYLGRSMICTVTIIRLQSTSWWFLACSGCHKTAYPAGNQFICSDQKCKCAAAGPRYKVRLIGCNETGEAEFVFFAGMAEQIIGKKVDSLTRAAARRPDSIPAEISAIVSQKYTLNISVNERGLEYGELSFQVNSIDVVHRKLKAFEFAALGSGSQDVAGASAGPESLSSLSTSAKGDDDAILNVKDSVSFVEPTKITMDSSVAASLLATPPSVTKLPMGAADNVGSDA